MNPVRLIGGWLLLCGLSAGGGYFAMDEADRRFDLAKYDLRAKVGLNSAPSPAPQPTPPAPGPSGGSSQPPSVTPPPQPLPQPGPSGGGSPGPIVTPPRPVPVPQPGGGRSSTPGGSSGIPGPRPNPPVGGQTGGGQNPAGGQNPSGTQNPPVNPNPIPHGPAGNPGVGRSTAGGSSTGSGGQPAPTPPAPAPGPASSKPTISTPDPRSSNEWRQLHDFYNQMAPRAEAVLNYMERMKAQTERNRGVFRVDLQTAMYGLRDGMTSARRALDSGDTDGARSYLTTAYQQLQALEQARH